ncbi:MAG: alpha-1,4-glucan--maltose-1-phosphate maltosyltransferase [Rhodanobacteraceae bacterium]
MNGASHKDAGGLPDATASRRQAITPPRRSPAGRVVIENVWPEIDCGRHPVKRVADDTLEVWADIFCDGHDTLAACVRWRDVEASAWREAPMAAVDNDRWRGRFPLEAIGRRQYTIVAWRDRFATWRSDFLKKREAGQPVELEAIEGHGLVAEAAAHAKGADRRVLAETVRRLDNSESDHAAILLQDDLLERMRRAEPRTHRARYARTLEVVVDRPTAVFGAWYEMFPRSAGNDAQRHGTFDDVIARLPYVRDLGFDVLYLPPIHPIGATHRKGRNNALAAAPGDPGSPWAIGSAEGGHDAVHPELGTLDDFRRLVAAAQAHGIEIALDFAIQCSRDHPWITEHPEWFDWRPDGSIRFAENPPKQYEDIVNVHFYRGALPSLWYALRDVVLFWVERGVRIFRVDNPHTKPVPFWEWLIREVQDLHPDVIFLAEAFTGPKMMKKLGKVGFTQSYTYFTWRNTKVELTEYLTELTDDLQREYLRPNFFVNTPDINPPFLQTGGRAAFRVRAALAATLSSLWGVYSGFELCEAAAIPGREEYLDSEKYQLKVRDFDAPGNIRADIARLNRIRRENPALQELANLRFHPAHDDNVIFYSKATADRDNVLLIAVNLDPHHPHEADSELPLYMLGLDDDDSIDVEDLMEGYRFTWRTKWQRLKLDPEVKPFAIWRITVPD